MTLGNESKRLPGWLKVKYPSGDKFNSTFGILKKENLCTVCSKAKCPNIGECYNKGTATFMIMGDTCTRDCNYCNVNSGIPSKLDPNEPKKIGTPPIQADNGPCLLSVQYRLFHTPAAHAR